MNRSSEYPIGVGMNYTKILSFTTKKFTEVIGPIQETDYPLNIEIADGLDGSGSHKVYNQVKSHNIVSRLKASSFSLSKYSRSRARQVLSNDAPNSRFVARLIALISLKKNHENNDFMMKTLINHETSKLEHSVFDTLREHVNVRIFFYLFDYSIAGTLSGAGGTNY